MIFFLISTSQSTYFKAEKSFPKRKLVLQNIDENGIDGPTKKIASNDKNNNKKKKIVKKKLTTEQTNGESKENVSSCSVPVSSESSEDSIDDIDEKTEFRFSMLVTDDEDDDDNSSDDEKDNSDSVKPTRPEWSSDSNRRLGVTNQNDIENKLVDVFFGCQYEIVEMRDIFPKIHAKRAKRRKSSMNWNTPPRYSILPKF